MNKTCLAFLVLAILPALSSAQHEHHEHANPSNSIVEAEPQPLLAHAIRLSEALSFLGSSLSKEDQQKLKELRDQPLTKQTSKQIQTILDPYCLAHVDINPEARVMVTRGVAPAKLMQHGWTSFLVKVKNSAGVTAKLKAESSNAAPVLHITSYPMQAHARKENLLTPGQVANRFLDIQMYYDRPLSPNLSGLSLEYAVVQIYCKEAGKREAEIGFNIGQGTQDIGFRSNINVLFTILPSVKVIFDVFDEDGSPTTASLVVTDGVERVIDKSITSLEKSGIDYRHTLAQMEYWEGSSASKIPRRLTGIYPLPSRRVAAYDKYPDFFFQPQVYRSYGEHIFLPPGKFNVAFTRGPEYQAQSKEITVPSGIDSMHVEIKLKRWIDMSKLGWYSADHHVHAAGCSHYESPEEGVKPIDMWRQIVGEDLDVGAVLTWGPGWYHQKQFFNGKIHSLSTSKNVMRYDVEVSGFPSSHAGHIVLLNLKEDDYPGTQKVEDWPSWTLPVFKWAKSQDALAGYAHSGWGLEPTETTDDLPNYVLPKMDGIGANEYIVTVTENVVDFFSAGDTPAPWELNMWYHSLNAGFKTRLSGETDFPCIFDERVGIARSYFKQDGTLSFDGYIDAIRNGRSYVSEGNSHIIDFTADGQEVGTKNSELNLKGTHDVTINASVVAFLPKHQNEDGAIIANRPLDRKPYWNIERARLQNSRKVPIELIVNGISVDTTEITADGTWSKISFKHRIAKSSWVALRIYPSVHTNPIFIVVDSKPVRVKQSAEWCRRAVDQCWKKKHSNIRASEREEAAQAYDRARKVYDKIIKESSPE
jgi:hypothetical protein